jgi:hypothetical protein
MRKQYYFRPSPNGFFAWDVDRLIKLTEDFKPQPVSLDSIKELDEVYWFGDEGDRPTCREIIQHVRLINEADPDYPIILSADGRVMDGMHRVAKAVLGERDTIQAVQFENDPEPDYLDVYPDDLPY